MTMVDPMDVGVASERLGRITRAMQDDVDAGLYDGGVICLARRGRTVLNAAVGWSDRASERSAKVTDVFPILSLSKSMVATMILSRIERGQVRFTTPVAEIIPEFAEFGKRRVTVAQVLGHTGGMPPMPTIPLERWGHLDEVVSALCKLPPVAMPAERVSYSGFAAYSIIADIVCRLDAERRPFREIMQQELFEPLGMATTSMGQNPELESRRVPLVLRDNRNGRFSAEFVSQLNDVLAPGSQLPSAGCYSTASDYLRFVEMLARGGEFEGKRILSPLTIGLATKNFTGSMPNLSWAMYREVRGWEQVPAYLGLGFYLRGEGIFPNYFGSLNSSRTFGHAGLGSCMYWVDPAVEMSFVVLTAGLMEESRSIERFQRLGDLALSSIVDV
jgi:CubicO group peptidase (beta-lactamase class C family)